MRIVFFLFLTLFAFSGYAENGYELWLRYHKIGHDETREAYTSAMATLLVDGGTQTLIKASEEMQKGLSGMLGKAPLLVKKPGTSACIVLSTSEKWFAQSSNMMDYYRNGLTDDGFVIKSMKIKKGTEVVFIGGKTDLGVLYGVFHFLRMLQTNQKIDGLAVMSSPVLEVRMLNHWDNLDGSVERGYSGKSIWDWQSLPEIKQRYIDYARANASLGINGTVLNNVNSNSTFLTTEYLHKLKALADAFRPYGIKVYLTARFTAPMEIGRLQTADPLNEQVLNWWKEKTREIYALIPDFGGYLIKANSEGMPGPQDYGRNHADGANMFAKALKPFGGSVIWRAFVYDYGNLDRIAQAYNEFNPLDGKFDDNMFLQVKNGPLDFQPREPYSPLFSALSQTPAMMEFQVTQEYTGQGTHLVFMAPYWKEVLQTETFVQEKGGSTIQSIIEGKVFSFHHTGIAGVSNIGNVTNWCNHPFAQANWYAYGRLAWDTGLTSAQIANEWLRMTFSNNPDFINVAQSMMLNSYEHMVNYMMPLGLTHLMAAGDHRGPAPWYGNRPDFHRANNLGIGYDGTANGSNIISQYPHKLASTYGNPKTCPEELLLWFHHLPWDFEMKSGRALWDELCFRYQSGVDAVRQMQHHWETVEEYIDRERFEQVRDFLVVQEKEARWWRDACILYFQSINNLPVPSFVEKPDHDLEFFKKNRIY
jgi:alpha-glucuronidase